MEQNKITEEWYSKKELYEMIGGLKVDLMETQRVVKEYNNLRKELNSVIKRLTALEERRAGRLETGKLIREWGGWLVAVVTLLYALGVICN